MSEEKLIDIKGTIEQFVKADEPEMSQEEAIMQYNPSKKNSDSDDTVEEEEHLKRIKQELLASLARVDKLEKEIFKSKDIDTEELKKLRVNKSSNAGRSLHRSLENERSDQKERD